MVKNIFRQNIKNNVEHVLTFLQLIYHLLTQNSCFSYHLPCCYQTDIIQNIRHTMSQTVVNIFMSYKISMAFLQGIFQTNILIFESI